jgi:hypothetical protein
MYLLEAVIPGQPAGLNPESISPDMLAEPWIPGLRRSAHPGMTKDKGPHSVPRNDGRGEGRIAGSAEEFTNGNLKIVPLQYDLIASEIGWVTSPRIPIVMGEHERKPENEESYARQK